MKITEVIKLAIIFGAIGAYAAPAELVYKQCPRTSCPGVEEWIKTLGWVRIRESAKNYTNTQFSITLYMLINRISLSFFFQQREGKVCSVKVRRKVRSRGICVSAMAKNVISHILYFNIFSNFLFKCYSISIIIIDFA